MIDAAEAKLGPRTRTGAPREGGPARARIVRIDAHGHYDSFHSPDRYLSCAVANFAAWGGAPAGAPEAPPHLFIAASGSSGGLPALLQALESGRAEGWRAAPTDESVSKVLLRDGRPQLVVIAARQIVTLERIEVLALGTDDAIPNGRSLRETVGRALGAGAIAVIPWGFGKWWGRRGRTLREFLRTWSGQGLLLGDSRNRPRWTPLPGLVRTARERGIGLLPGSDPFPIHSGVGAAGTFGCELEIDWDPRRPWRSVRDGLLGGPGAPRSGGARVGLARFFIDQAALRVRRIPGGDHAEAAS